MLDTVSGWLGADEFMPHGYCFLWTPPLLWVNATSDLVIGASYLSIPFALWYFVEKRPDVPFRWVFVMFGVFVLACGSTHLFSAWNLWHADYWAEAAAKAITASVSVATAIALWLLMPKALAIPSPTQLEIANRNLQNEMSRRELAESALHAANHDLERLIAQRTEELKRANDSLRESEERFRRLTEMSSDFYWESDAEHRLRARGSADNRLSTVSVFRQGAQIGERRWEIPHLSPDESGWQAHRAVLDAHQPFRNFEFSRVGIDGTEHHISISGDPVFDASGAFKGYFGVGTDVSERKKYHEGLTLFRALIDQSSDGIEVLDPDTFRFLDINQRSCLDLGYSREEMLSMDIFDVDTTFDRSTAAEIVQELKQSGTRILDSRHRRRDGSEFPVEVSLTYVELDRDYVVSVVRNVTERKVAEARIRRLTQLYAALSQCNQAIVRCASTEELFPQICHDAVEFGGMKMAWIGLVDPRTRTVRVAASFGDHADEYLQGIEISLDAQTPFGRGPTGTAVRENQPFWCQDFLHDPRTAPWHERGAQFGWGATAALPLHRNGATVGALTLYAGEVGAFDEEARHLLTEMATDISFALDNFAHEDARRQANADLLAAEGQFRSLVEQSIAGIFIIQDDKLAYVNPRFAEIFGYAGVDEMIGRESLSLVIEAERSRVLEQRRQIEGGEQSISYGFSALRKDGAVIEVGVHASRATHKGRPAIIGLLQDISEKKRAEEQIQRHIAQLEIAFMSTVQVATTLGEMRDPYTAGHQRRVAKIAVAIGAELGFDARRQEGLRIAGYLHDIGKITIPAEILSKPGRLSAIEFQLIQGHPQSGYEVLKDLEFPWPVAQVALQHHERMDGSGYPQGLKGEAILLEARIMAVADVVEAMTTHRPYRPGLGIDKSLAEIERGRGTVYDPAVADACLKMFREKGYSVPE